MLDQFIDEHRQRCGVDPICKELQIAPSAYRRRQAQCLNPALRSARAVADEVLKGDIERVWQANYCVYGYRKVWHALKREGNHVARCTVARIMAEIGLQGARRGKSVRTTVSKSTDVLPLDFVNRQFQAQRPDQLWVADFTYVSTWQGMVFVAFIIDAYSRRIVGWRVSRTMRTEFVLDALEQALYSRGRTSRNRRDHAEDLPLIHHSDRGSQYVSIRYGERLKEAGIEPSVGSTGDSYDNALAETINGLYKTELIYRKPWRSIEAVEIATLAWVAWFNNHRLFELLRYIPPAEFEAKYYEQLKTVSLQTESV
jgi:putative transposase